ncbi:MAG: tetratricopeptide repeat protein [Candidatus Eremiobacteraeota bacterium]|nr:tetratricopeptide repeat protein [Candidatus Eremiobacteraeota bacterium]
MTDHSHDQLFQEAHALKKERRYREALPLYEELLRGGFRSAFFLSSAAHLYFLLKEYEKALELVESSLHLRPGEPFTLSLKGKLLLALGYRDEALTLYRDLSTAPLPAATARDVVMFLSRNGAPGEASACLERLIARDPSRKELQLLKADMDKIQHGTGAQSGPPVANASDGDLYARQIEARIRELPREEALGELATLMTIPSRRENLRLMKLHARMLYEAKRYREAYEAYEELWKKEPGDRFALSQMAFALVHTGEYERSRPLLEEIFTMEPENVYVKNSLIKAYRVTATEEHGILFLQGIIARHPALRHLWGDIRKLSKPREPEGTAKPRGSGGARKTRKSADGIPARRRKETGNL